ncbi:hypothetical protein [Muriicola sp. Z0-33]|uniref:hypothetical protein n=1 Tax=Muriicola sp. Z0-33 TaxID=2816957 RepID=UPI002236FDDA|nr:hypothetical protein [Muriicola sp. Z0-33]MCW5518073.1 hypothetical protein [Muriicola sp. Z0-33]
MQKLLLLLLLSISLISSAQSEKYAGKYELVFKASNANISYDILLNPNGTFLFHRYRHVLVGNNKEENSYGKGVWKPQKKNLIYFFTNHKNDIDATHTLNLNNTKARFISKSPRDKSDREIKTALKFYESELSWVTGKELFKIE